MAANHWVSINDSRARYRSLLYIHRIYRYRMMPIAVDNSPTSRSLLITANSVQFTSYCNSQMRKSHSIELYAHSDHAGHMKTVMASYTLYSAVFHRKNYFISIDNINNNKLYNCIIKPSVILRLNTINLICVDGMWKLCGLELYWHQCCWNVCNHLYRLLADA